MTHPGLSFAHCPMVGKLKWGLPKVDPFYFKLPFKERVSTRIILVTQPISIRLRN
jgi:hypothetical protein